MKVVAVDLSGVMHANKHSLRDLVTKRVINGVETLVPTGHVFGTLRTVVGLASQTDLVILCADSYSKKRKAIIPSYKEGRDKTGYNIYNDLYSILNLCTYIKNVVYVKETDLESDDLINSLVRIYSQKSDVQFIIYGVDNDLFQTPAKFLVSSSLIDGYIQYTDLRGYIEKKYELNLPYLPIWYKVLKGDPSDKIPNASPRYPKNKIIQICMDLRDTQSFDSFIEYLVKNNHEALLKNKEQLYKNYQVVMPFYVEAKDIHFKKLPNQTQEQIKDLLSYYSMESFIANGFLNQNS